MGVWLREPLARGVTGGFGVAAGAGCGIAGAALGGGIIGLAIPASARMRGVITGVGIVENDVGEGIGEL